MNILLPIIVLGLFVAYGTYLKYKQRSIQPVLSRRKRFEQATKLWQILDAALEDFILIEANDDYTIDMGNWHCGRRYDDYTCTVCVAGAVMANSFNAPLTAMSSELFKQCGQSTRYKLYAIDSLREGAIFEACVHLYQSFKSTVTAYDEVEQVVSKWWTLPKEFKVTSYERDSTQWKKDMGKLIAYLHFHDL